mmetsp:Transcript_10138/g.22290  ORF Transcript_10138/g.22290 Transcript_10138/m.22290 type:complete len:529 (-) Transcript_10138:282-1868(-)
MTTSSLPPNRLLLEDIDYSNCLSLDLYTTVQEHVLAFLPYVTAPLSFIGSSLILWAIWYDRRVLLRLVYHRLVFAMSLLDWLNSFGMIFLGAWTVPADYPYGRAGRGTTQTCRASGVFLTLLTGAVAYSAFLALSFVMTIRWEWKERRIACCMEPFAHFFGFLFPAVSAISGAVNDYIHPLWTLPGWCWFTEYTPFCHASNNTYCMEDGELLLPTECSRGDGFHTSSDTMSFGNVIFLWVVVVICMILIVTKVFRMERRIQRQYGDTTASLNRTRETAQQSLLYIGVFMVSFLPISVLQLVTDNEDDPVKNKAVIFVLALLTKTLTPLIGFFNAFIYFRKRFRILLREDQSLAFLTTLPWIGPWMVELSRPRRRTPTTTTMTNSTTSRRYSSVVGLRPDQHARQQQQHDLEITEEKEQPPTGPSHLPKRPYPDIETFENETVEEETNDDHNQQDTASPDDGKESDSNVPGGFVPPTGEETGDGNRESETNKLPPINEISTESTENDNMASLPEPDGGDEENSNSKEEV